MSQFPHPIYSQTVLIPAYDDAQQHLFAHMLATHEAHAIMLARQQIITMQNAVAILNAVAQIRTTGVDALGYQPGIEDLFFRVESQIIEQAGADYGGNLQLARSRNDLGQALARMALRQEVLALSSDLLALRKTIHARATDHIDTLMPGYTHTQPAQPITFAHYLAGILTFLAKDQTRLATAFKNVNESPLGAAAFTGTGFNIDRNMVAHLLGFDDVISSTHHSIGAGDHLTDIAFAVQSIAVGLSRVTKDLIFFATQESGALHIDDSFIQISSIMPQKRNPVVLEHLRARLSRATGAAQTVTIQCHNIPYGDTQDIEDEILPPLLLAMQTLHECLILYTAVFDTLTLNKEHLRQRAADGFTTATELADLLVREVGLPFRQSHKIVAGMVQNAVNANIAPANLTLERLQQSAKNVLGNPIKISDEQFQRALDPQNFVDVRTGIGGVSAQSTTALLSKLRDEWAMDSARVGEAQSKLDRVLEERAKAVAEILSNI